MIARDYVENDRLDLDRLLLPDRRNPGDELAAYPDAETDSVDVIKASIRSAILCAGPRS